MMKIRFYVIHRDSSIYSCFVVIKEEGVNTYLLGKKTIKTLSDESRIHEINSYEFRAFLNELDCCPNYNRAVARNIKSSNTPYVVKLIPNRVEYIDKTW